MSRILSNLHTHTNFSDGQSSMVEYIEVAIAKGYVSIGFSDHAYAPYDEDCCIKKATIPQYLAEIRELQTRYQDQIEIYAGWENDFYHPSPRDDVDFLIGSIHYLRDDKTGEYFCIDYKRETYEQAIKQIGAGDVRRFVETYYQLVIDMVQTQQPDIVGHFDLIEKLNENNCYFNAAESWYLKLTEQVAQAIRESGCIIEINTGGLTRGYTTEPYPRIAILEQLYGLQVPITVSSDAHHIKHLDAYFEKAAAILQEVGYQHLMQLKAGKFVKVAL